MISNFLGIKNYSRIKIGKNNDKNKIDKVNNKIEAILAGASTDLDSFKELVDYINSIDAENDEALAKFIKDTLAKFGVLFKSQPKRCILL